MKRVAWTWCGLVLTLAMGCPPDEVGSDSDAGTDQGGDPSGDGSTGGANGGGGEDDPCAVVRCKAGTHCEATEVQCVKAPCPPIAECVPDEEQGPGCELIDCLPEYTCVEDDNGVGSCVPVGGGVSCGKNTCAEGQVCCNASCGICTPPDGACIQIACEDEPTCDRVCELGTHCERVDVACLVAPCEPVEECVPDAEECTGPIIDCAAPPPGCNYEGGGCVNGQWTCGTLVCGELCGDIACGLGQHCEDSCAAASQKPGLVAPIPVPCERVCVDDLECTGPIPPCAAPPPGCDYQGGGCVKGNWTCGTLVCDACAALDCASCTVVDGKAQCGTPCGENTCLNGQECCNASCGTCVDPGMACIQIACEPTK